MPLFWIVQEIDGKRRVLIQEGSTLNFARFDAVIAGVGGHFVGGHMLDDKRANPEEHAWPVVDGSRGQCAA